MPGPQDPHLNELYHQIDPIKDHARQVAESLAVIQLRWRPEPKSWGVGDCLEHLCITAESYYDRMDRAIAIAAKTGASAKWRPTFLGRILIKAVTTSRRMKRPSVFKPPVDANADVLARFLRLQDRLAELMLAADGLDLNRVKVSSPVSRFLGLNLGDCFIILVLHAKRHLRQAARVAESRRMPKLPPDTEKG